MNIKAATYATLVTLGIAAIVIAVTVWPFLILVFGGVAFVGVVWYMLYNTFNYR